MKSFKKYFIVLLMFMLVIPSIVFAVWWNPFSWFNYWGRGNQKNEQKVLVLEPNDNDSIISTTSPSNGEIIKTPVVIPEKEIETLYNIKMAESCYNKFQIFLNESVSDYSKCLVDFNFNDGYCRGFNPDTQGLSDVNLIVILDASGSMAEKIGSVTKIDIAKKAVSDLLIAMPKGVNTGLIVYGHQGSNYTKDKDLSCAGIEDIVDLSPDNSNNIISSMNSFNPKGWTPIADSLSFAKDILKNNGIGDKNYLILVSDGIESCDGDPLMVAKEISNEIPGIKLNIIGFTSDNIIQESLKKIANAGGGSYLTASNSLDINNAFNKELLAIKKECLAITLYQMYMGNKINNVKNLECWLDLYKKEADNFTNFQLNQPLNTECKTEIASALNNRRNNFWYQKEILEKENDLEYKQIELDFNTQLKDLSN